MCNKQPVTWTVCLRFCVCSLLCASGVCNSEKSPCCRGHWEGRTRYNMVSSFAKCVFRRVLVSLVYVGTSLQTCSLNCQCKSTLHNRIGTVPISSCQRAAKRENGLAACQKAKKKQGEAGRLITKPQGLVLPKAKQRLRDPFFKLLCKG